MADFIIENGVLVKYKGEKRSVYIPSEVARIGKYALAGCEKTEIVTIRDGVTGIDEGAFMKCFYLREIVIPESVSMIGVCAFADCRRLESVLLCGVEIVEAWAFDHCDGLRSVILGNDIKKIGDHAFYDCYSLEKIVIPVNVEQIGKDVFARCPHLTIYAPENSYAELYAIERDIPFHAL